MAGEPVCGMFENVGDAPQELRAWPTGLIAREVDSGSAMVAHIALPDLTGMLETLKDAGDLGLVAELLSDAIKTRG
jgi:hypothetical protein